MDFTFKSVRLELLILLVLFVDLFLTKLPLLIPAALILMLQFTRLNLASNTFMCLIGLSGVIGNILNGVGIPHVGGLILLVGVSLFAYGIITKKTQLYLFSQSLSSLSILFVLFLVSVLTTSGGDFAGEKLGATVYQGTILLIAFTVLFSNMEKISPLTSVYLIIYSLLILRASININGTPGPTSLLSFGFMKVGIMETHTIYDDDFLLNYQDVGYYFLHGIAILFMKELSRKPLTIFLFLLGILVTLYSGARQTIVIAILLYFLWMVLELKNKKLLFVFVCLSFVFYSLLAASEGLSQIFEDTQGDDVVESSGRGPWLLRGVQLFLENPLWGVGFGRYNIFGEYGIYPHNLIVEILCETGLLGFFVCLALSINRIVKTKKVFAIYVYYFLILLLQSFASRGLEQNISVFAFLCALPALQYSRRFANKSLNS